jgi:hypothetical protein
VKQTIEVGATASEDKTREPATSARTKRWRTDARLTLRYRNHGSAQAGHYVLDSGDMPGLHSKNRPALRTHP